MTECATQMASRRSSETRQTSLSAGGVTKLRQDARDDWSISAGPAPIASAEPPPEIHALTSHRSAVCVLRTLFVRTVQELIRLLVFIAVLRMKVIGLAYFCT